MNNSAPDNMYQYNGKENNTDHGLNLLDYGARWYNPVIGRYTSIDPFTTDRGWITPYNYVQNNPMLKIDTDGALDGDYFDSKGKYLGTDGVEDNKIYLMNSGSTPNYSNKEVNWGGKLSSTHANQLKQASQEVGGLIVLNRIEEGSDYTISEVFLSDHSSSGFSLEPAGPFTSESNKDRRIPTGTYDLYEYSSKKFPNTYIVCNGEVPIDRKILLHTGNYGENTIGCILSGCEKTVGRVNNSLNMLNDIRNFISSVGVENVKLIINEDIK